MAGGHTTETPVESTYSSVVSRDSVRLAFLIAALNDLEILACDVSNAYLNTPCKEKIWFQGGAECGEHNGKVIVIVRALYGLKTSGASWRSLFASMLGELGYTNTRVDPDVWRKLKKKPDGTPYYELVLVYVDNCLCISHAPKEFLDAISKVYVLKEDSVHEPDIYLGANIAKVEMVSGGTAWAMSSKKYVEAAISNVNGMLTEEGRELNKAKQKGTILLPSGYKPELDITDELDKRLQSRYLQLIGVLRWAVELGRWDIAYEVAIMSQYSASPREGHLEGLYHIFLYLSKHLDSAIIFDLVIPQVGEEHFIKRDWREFYGEVEEELPAHMPEPLGNPVVINYFVDANHAGNVITRRSHTGILMYINNAPILCYSKKQNTVESSTFGSELVALRIAKDMIIAMRIKLRMFGVPIRGFAYVHCDNNGVVKNTSIPESTLHKKHNSINYHSVREAVATDILRIGKEDTESNLADLFTKSLSGERRMKLLRCILKSIDL